MKKYDDPLLYVYTNRDNKEKIIDKLYDLCPDLKRVDEGTDKHEFAVDSGYFNKAGEWVSDYVPKLKKNKQGQYEFYYYPGECVCIHSMKHRNE